MADGRCLNKCAVDILKATEQGTEPVQCRCPWGAHWCNWRIRLNYLCVAAMWPCVKLITVIVSGCLSAEQVEGGDSLQRSCDKLLDSSPHLIRLSPFPRRDTSDSCDTVYRLRPGNNKCSNEFDKKSRIAAAHGRFSGIRQVTSVSAPPNTCFLRPTEVQNPNGISIGSVIFAQLTADCRRACLGMSFPLKIAPCHGAIWTLFGPPESTLQTASRSVQPFLQGSPQSIPRPILTRARQ